MKVILFLLVVTTSQVSESKPIGTLLKLKAAFSKVNIVKDIFKNHGLTVAIGGVTFFEGIEEISTTDFSLPTKYAHMEKSLRLAWDSVRRSSQLIQNATNGLSRNNNCFVAFITILVLIFVWTCCAIKNEVSVKPLK